MIKNHEESIEINYNPNWSYIPNQPDRIFICLGSEKRFYVTEFNKTSTTSYWKSLLIRGKSTRIKVSITYQQKRKGRD